MQREFVGEDFVEAMSDLGNILKFPTDKKDMFLNQMIDDASIHCFQRAVIHFKEYMEAIVGDIEISTDTDDENVFEKRMCGILQMFWEMEVINEHQFDTFGALFGASIIFTVGRRQLETDDERKFYDASIKKIPAYFRLIEEFVTALVFIGDEDAEKEQGHDD